MLEKQQYAKEHSTINSMDQNINLPAELEYIIIIRMLLIWGGLIYKFQILRETKNTNKKYKSITRNSIKCV